MYQALQHHSCLDVRFAILPLGTANNLARAVGIPMDIEAAVETAANGVERLIDLGTANGKVFTQAAGVGFHAHAFHVYGHHRDKSLIDASRAFISALRDWHPQPMRITIDGVDYMEDAVQVTAANTPFYGRHAFIAPEARVDDGLLDVVIISGCKSKFELIGCIVKVMEGMSPNASNVTRVQAKHVDIAPLDSAEIPAHADAEPIGYAPVSIEVLSSCLRLMVPA